MKKCRLWSAAGLAFLLAVTSCTKYEGDVTSGEQPQGDPVEVNFSMTVRSLSAGDDATLPLLSGEHSLTRTIPDGIVDGLNAPVKNLWVIQFEEGVDGDAAFKASRKMVGVPRFISGDDLDDHSGGTVQLIGTAEDCFIIWVANHPGGADYKWNLPLNATLADVAAKMTQLTKEEDTWPEIDGDRTIMMNAITTSSVDAGYVLEPKFYRNYAKVSLNLTMDAAGYKVTSVRLRNAPRNVSLSELALGPDFTNIVSSDATIYPYGSPVMDYDAVAPTAGNLDAEGETETFTWYVPRNQQGTSASSTYSEKSYYAPVNATYFEVIAQDKNDLETAVFRVYPGANQVDDYTLLPNHAYTSSLNVKGIGDSYTPDSRVENFDDVEHTEAANCYILNPAPAGGSARRYTIPITNAVRYWSGTAAGYGNDPANVIGAGDQWQVSLLWSDDQTTTDQISFQDNGEGLGPDGKFTLSVPAGLPACNFTVKLTRRGSSTVLWSWHFWVTDYNPDAFNFNSIDRTTKNPGGIPDGRFTYPVPNGQVERYSGAIWNGDYAEKVMMDRSLGAVENYFTTQPTAVTRGHLHYQFGRKDPFPAVEANLTTGVAPLSYGSITIRTANNSPETIDSRVPMADAVMNPSIFYNRMGSGQWCSDADGYVAPHYVWHDPEASIGNLNVNVDYGKKSIYDPCPPGWKVPSSGTFIDFAITNGTIQNEVRDLGWTGGRGLNNVNALRYWPGGSTDPVGGTIYYAASGFRNPESARLVNLNGVGGYSWIAMPYSGTAGRSLVFSAGSIGSNNATSRAYGLPVRCVSDRRN